MGLLLTEAGGGAKAGAGPDLALVWMASVPILLNGVGLENLANISATSESRHARQVVCKGVSPLSRRCISWEPNVMDTGKHDCLLSHAHLTKRIRSSQETAPSSKKSLL